MFRSSKKPFFTNSFGKRDFYRYYTRHRNPRPEYVLKEHEFGRIIRVMNNLFREGLAEGKSLFLPYGLGSIEPRKCNVTPYLKEGKLMIPMGISWKETRKLWRESPEDEKNKTLVRQKSGYHYYLCYRRGYIGYRNMMFLEFYPDRKLVSKFQENAKNNKIDAPLLWKRRQL